MCWRLSISLMCWRLSLSLMCWRLSISLMCSCMLFQTLPVPESFEADFTVKGPLPAMNERVTVEEQLVVEAHRADVALEGFLARMRLHMLLQIAFQGIPLTTNLTFVIFLPRV